VLGTRTKDEGGGRRRGEGEEGGEGSRRQQEEEEAQEEALPSFPFLSFSFSHVHFFSHLLTSQH
jgi:hypothetical protein